MVGVVMKNILEITEGDTINLCGDLCRVTSVIRSERLPLVTLWLEFNGRPFSKTYANSAQVRAS